MTDQEAFEAWWHSNPDRGPSRQQIEAWNAALAWLRSQQEPVAWMIDWPDEPELGCLLAEGCIDESLGRNRPLFLAPQPAIPDGWKLVPVEPTEEMLKAAIEAELCDTYCAMLNAAPEPRK